MTATTTAPAPTTLDRHRAATLADDAPLDTYLAELRVLATATVADLAPDTADPDMARAVALGHLQGTLLHIALHATSRFGAEVRAAPPSGLAEVVADVMKPCADPGCNNEVAPWQDSTCGPGCVKGAAAAHGEWLS